VNWRWIGAELVYALHDRLIAEHGGPDGLRDRNALESALARPQNLAAYENPDAASLAAAYAYAFGVARNHGFLDGNKRTAWMLARLFLADNGFVLSFDAIDAVRTVEALAAGSLDEVQLAAWFRARLNSKD
jgi:death-on-curing protein